MIDLGACAKPSEAFQTVCSVCACVLSNDFASNIGFHFEKKGATLLEIKKSFRDVDNVLYDWTDSPSSDFCVWRGVNCDNVTFTVLSL